MLSLDEIFPLSVNMINHWIYLVPMISLLTKKDQGIMFRLYNESQCNHLQAMTDPGQRHLDLGQWMM